MDVRRSAIDAVGGALHRVGAFRLLHAAAFRESVAVIMYHGLLDAPLPVPDWCFLPVERFTEQMEYLARHFEVVHLEEAFAPERPRSAKPLACVTFDDGFASNYHLALPVLERLGLPATVYLVTGGIDSDETIWFARLHQAVCETRAEAVVLGSLRLPLSGRTARVEASLALRRSLQVLPPPRFAAELAGVLEQLGVRDGAPPALFEAFRLLTREQIHRMAQDDLVRFGAHTTRHQILTRTTPEDARSEIEKSVAWVAETVERPSRSFAYPHGEAGDFDATSIAELQRLGIPYAVSTIPGPNRPGTDPHAILRYGIGDDYALSRFAALAHHARHALDRGLGRQRGTDAPVP